MGICLPTTCSVKDVEEISIFILSKYNLNVTSVHCENNQPMSFRVRTIAIVIFILVLLTAICSTIYEVYMNHRESKWDYVKMITKQLIN